MVTFCFDRIIDGKPYPNLAQHNAKPFTHAWRKFSKKWPFSEPLHFLEYCDQENVEYQLVTTPENAIYPVSLSFFSFDVKWFDLCNSAVLSALKAKTCVLWFFYSEGDHPQRIQQHLQAQAQEHSVPWSQIRFTSANSAADDIENFSYFVDDEMLYRLRNEAPPVEYHEQIRKHKYTALVRTHKWWRASTMARLWKRNLHHFGYFSYNTELDVGEAESDNPIEVDSFGDLRKHTKLFLANGPYCADNYDSDYHNLYHYTIPEHYNDSYLNLILETHLDVDQSGGTFLTEKTFKPIKNCQLFVIVGAAGSVAQLRKMGYRTFDTVIDHSYDAIENNTKRWYAVMQEFEHLIMHENLHTIYSKCKKDLLHNQQLFLSSKKQRLNTLLQKVQNEFS